MAGHFKSRGIASVIVGGSVRDADALTECDIAVYAKGVASNGQYKNDSGKIKI